MRAPIKQVGTRPFEPLERTYGPFVEQLFGLDKRGTKAALVAESEEHVAVGTGLSQCLGVAPRAGHGLFAMDGFDASGSRELRPSRGAGRSMYRCSPHRGLRALTWRGSLRTKTPRQSPRQRTRGPLPPDRHKRRFQLGRQLGSLRHGGNRDCRSRSPQLCTESFCAPCLFA